MSKSSRRKARKNAKGRGMSRHHKVGKGSLYYSPELDAPWPWKEFFKRLGLFTMVFLSLFSWLVVPVVVLLVSHLPLDPVWETARNLLGLFVLNEALVVLTLLINPRGIPPALLWRMAKAIFPPRAIFLSLPCFLWYGAQDVWHTIPLGFKRWVGQATLVVLFMAGVFDWLMLAVFVISWFPQHAARLDTVIVLAAVALAVIAAALALWCALDNGDRVVDFLDNVSFLSLPVLVIVGIVELLVEPLWRKVSRRRYLPSWVH